MRSTFRPPELPWAHGTLWLLPLLLATIPGFYVELLREQPGPFAMLVYLAAAVGVAWDGWRQRRAAKSGVHLGSGATRRTGVNLTLLDTLLALGLLVAALLPPSRHSDGALLLRLLVAFMTLARMVLLLRPLMVRGRLSHMLGVALVVLFGCGVGYWWLEPTTPTLAEGMWLAFVTAATIGYGDYTPTTTASRIFSVFVLMLGFGVLSLITASIATAWIQREERRMERDILRDVHREIGALRGEVAALRTQLGRQAAGAADDLAAAPSATVAAAPQAPAAKRRRRRRGPHADLGQGRGG